MEVGLGTAAIGRPQYINIKSEESELTLAEFKERGLCLLDEAYDLGIRYFDTAPGYGMAEEMLLDWLRSRQYEDVEIATKWGYTYVANFIKDAKVHEVKDHSIEKLIEQWSQSKKFGKSLKLYQIHSAGFDTDVLFDERVHQELLKIKNSTGALIGLTSSGAEQVKTIKRALEIKIEGEELFDAFQVTYNVFDQSLLSIIDELKEKGKKVIVKEALANGRIFPNQSYPHNEDFYNKLKELSLKYRVGVDAIALRFIVDSIKPYKVLSGASLNSELKSNLNAVDFTLEADDVNALKVYIVAPKEYWAERKRLVWN